MGQGAYWLMFVELVFDGLDPERDDLGFKVVFDFPNIIQVKNVKLFFLGFESLQDFAFDHVVSFLLQLPDDQFKFFYLIQRLHHRMARSLHLVSNDVCGFVHLLNPMVDVILDE